MQAVSGSSASFEAISFTRRDRHRGSEILAAHAARGAGVAPTGAQSRVVRAAVVGGAHAVPAAEVRVVVARRGVTNRPRRRSRRLREVHPAVALEHGFMRVKVAQVAIARYPWHPLHTARGV